MSLFKSIPSMREQIKRIADPNQIQIFEDQLLHHELHSSADALSFQFWLENPISTTLPEYHFALSNLEWFFIQENNGEIAYGGNQYWWKHKHFSNAGCGTVAACNIVYYIACYTHQAALLRNSQLYNTEKPVSESDFMDYMEDMVQYVTPNQSGISTVAFFQSGFEKYIQSLHHAPPTWFVLSASHKTEESIFKAAQFIRTHLAANRPIACLHWFHVGRMQVFNPTEAKESITDMNWHWVTITELYQIEDNWRIVVSSCGLRYELDFFHFLHGTPSFVTMELHL